MKTTHLISAISTTTLIALVGCSTTVNSPDRACAIDSSVTGCVGGSTGYSCGNGQAPDQNDSSLVCSDGTTGNDGFIDYCCIQFTSTSCAPDSSVQGCTGYSYGFSCTGGDTPDQADSTLVCSEPTTGNGVLLYCCQGS